MEVIHRQAVGEPIQDARIKKLNNMLSVIYYISTSNNA